METPGGILVAPLLYCVTSHATDTVEGRLPWVTSIQRMENLDQVERGYVPFVSTMGMTTLEPTGLQSHPGKATGIKRERQKSFQML